MGRLNPSWLERHFSCRTEFRAFAGMRVVKMSGTILVGAGREIRRVPDDAFVQSIKRLPARMVSRLAFTTSDHHLVLDFVVREMPRQRSPISPLGIANVTGLSLRKVSVILSDLE